MTPKLIAETVLRLLQEIAPEVDVRSIDPDVSFHDQYEFDSVDFLRLMIAIERALEVEINDFDYPQLSTLNGCTAYLSKLTSAA